MAERVSIGPVRGKKTFFIGGVGGEGDTAFGPMYILCTGVYFSPWLEAFSMTNTHCVHSWSGS
jgi:hypothetical protein